MIGINSSDNNNPAVNKSDSFRKFWLNIEKENLKKLELEKKVLKLKKRELLRQHILLVTIAPFAVLTALDLEAEYSYIELLDLIYRVVEYTVIPFTALSLTCTSYSIYNNRKIKKEEQKLRDLESAEVTGKNSIFHNQDDYMNYTDICITTSTILGNIVSQVSEQYIVEDSILLLSNIVGFCMSCAFYRSECKKSKKKIGEESGKKTSNINSAKFILIGTAAFLVQTIMFMTTEPSVDTDVIGYTIGLAGISSIMTGYVLNTRFYSSELQDIKVTEEAEIGSNIIDIDHDNLAYESGRERA